MTTKDKIEIFYNICMIIGCGGGTFIAVVCMFAMLVELVK